MIVMDHDEREVPFELRVRLLYGGDEIAVVMALDEVHDDLGIGLRRKRVALGDELFLQLAVVLDDAVEHDRDCASSQPVSGCALNSVTAPCVAQRVWPSPVVESEPLSPAAA